MSTGRDMVKKRKEMEELRKRLDTDQRKAQKEPDLITEIFPRNTEQKGTMPIPMEIISSSIVPEDANKKILSQEDLAKAKKPLTEHVADPVDMKLNNMTDIGRIQFQTSTIVPTTIETNPFNLTTTSNLVYDIPTSETWTVTRDAVEQSNEVSWKRITKREQEKRDKEYALSVARSTYKVWTCYHMTDDYDRVLIEICDECKCKIK